VPQSLDDLTLGLLNKDPADRPKDATEVADRLRSIRDGIAREIAQSDIDKAAEAAEAAAEDRARAAAAALQAEIAALRASRRTVLDQAAGITASIASASHGTGHFEVFLQGRTGFLAHGTRHGGTWSGQPGIGLPEGQVSAVAAGYYRKLVRVILAVADGTPYLKQWWQEDGSWNCWADWAELRGRGQVIPAGVRDVAVASPAPGQLDVFALDGDGRICHRRLDSVQGRDPNWSPWREIPAPPAAAIAAVSHDENCQTLMAAADSGVQVNSWHRRDGWIGWHPLTRSRATDIACSSSAPGQLDFFTLRTDAIIAHRSRARTGDWSSWERMPGPDGKATAITSASAGGQHAGLAALTAKGIAHYTDAPSNGTPPHWSPLPLLLVIAPFPMLEPVPEHIKITFR
jgi:hypothetical protein